MSARIVIAGGGITGLAAAHSLRKRARAAGVPAEIIVVERDTKLGGKTQTDIVDGMVIENGPDSFIAHKPWFGELCTELGLPTVGTNPEIRSTYIYHRGRLEQLPVGMQIMIPTEVRPFVNTRLLSPLGKLRAAMEPLIPIKKTDEDESIASFVRRRFGPELLDNIAGPLMGGIYGGDYDAVSMKATFPMFMKMEREQGSLLLAARRNAANRPKGPTGSAFLTVPTGLHTVVQALAGAIGGDRCLMGTAVTGLAPTGDGSRYHLALSNGDRLEADAVILALPAYVAAELVRDYLSEVAGELDAILYGNSVVVTLAFRRSEVRHPLDGSGFLIPMREPVELTASTWVSAKWPHAAPADKVLMRCFLGRSGVKDWTKESDAAIIAAVRQGLQQVMGLGAAPVLTRIFRWPRANAQYRVGHLDRMEKIDRLMQRAAGLYLAGAAYRGIGLPDCVREGNQAADRVARHLGWRAS